MAETKTAPFEVTACDWKDCERKVAEGDAYCFAHAEVGMKMVATMEKAREVAQYKNKYRHLKSLDGLLDFVTEIIWKISRPIDPEEGEDYSPALDKEAVMSIFAGVRIARELVKDVTLERRIRAIDILLKERLHISLDQVLKNEEKARMLSYEKTAKAIGLELDEKVDDVEVEDAESVAG